MQRSEPHWFGVAPPQLLLSVAAIAFVFAIVLFATGHWPFGLILLGAAALLLAAFLEAARRRPDSTLTRDVRRRARARTLVVGDAARAPGSRGRGAPRSQNALLLLESDRRTALHELGAPPRGRRERPRRPRASASSTELDERETTLRAELDSGPGRGGRADPQGPAAASQRDRELVPSAAGQPPTGRLERQGRPEPRRTSSAMAKRALLLLALVCASQHRRLAGDNPGDQKAAVDAKLGAAALEDRARAGEGVAPQRADRQPDDADPHARAPGRRRVGAARVAPVRSRAPPAAARQAERALQAPDDPLPLPASTSTSSRCSGSISASSTSTSRTSRRPSTCCSPRAASTT